VRITNKEITMGSPRTGCVATLALLAPLLCPASATAVEIEASYAPNSGTTLQATVNQLCLAAQDGDRITIHLAAGEYHEQVSTTIGCGKAVSWHFAGAGVGQTVLRAAGVTSTFRQVDADFLYVALVACGTRNPWAKPSGENTCADHFDTKSVSYEFCLMGANNLDGEPEPFEPFTTSCELSNLTLDGTGASTSAIAMAWGSLLAHDIEVKNFAGNQIGCQNCRDVRIENVQLTCRTDPAVPAGGNGIAFAANTLTWEVGDASNQTGFRILHADIRRCNIGIVAQRLQGALIADNHIADSRIGIVLAGAGGVHVVSNWISGSAIVGMMLTATHQSTFASNLLSGHASAILFPASTATSVQGFVVPSTRDFFVGNVNHQDPSNQTPFITNSEGAEVFEHGTKTPSKMPSTTRWGW
jgi:hypothetical protein